MHIQRATLAVTLVLTVAASLSAFVSSPVRAADQTVLGKSLVVRDPKPGVDPSKRNVVVLGKELLSANSIVGNPLANGATVEIIANGASSTSQVFTLPPGASVSRSPGWKALGNPVTGYSYNDAVGANGPVKAALIQKAGSGTFIGRVTISGARGPGPQPHIAVVPPAPGTDGGMRFTIAAGDSYCVAFGGAAGGAVTNAPARGSPNKTFKIVSRPTAPTTEAGCPIPRLSTSTTSSSTTTTSTTSSTRASSTTTTSTATSTTTTSYPIPFCTTDGEICIGFAGGCGYVHAGQSEVTFDTWGSCQQLVGGSGNVCVGSTVDLGPCTERGNCPPDAVDRFVCAGEDGNRRCRAVCH